MYQSFSHNRKAHFPQCCPKGFIRFLCKCIINLFQGNLQSKKKTSHDKIPKQVSIFVSKTKNLEAKKETLQLIKVVTPPVINHLSWHGAVFLFLASVYSKSLNAQSVTKQEIPNDQVLQNPTYQIDSLKKEINKTASYHRNFQRLCKEGFWINENIFFPKNTLLST